MRSRMSCAFEGFIKPFSDSETFSDLVRRRTDGVGKTRWIGTFLVVPTIGVHYRLNVWKFVHLRTFARRASTFYQTALLSFSQVRQSGTSLPFVCDPISHVPDIASFTVHHFRCMITRNTSFPPELLPASPHFSTHSTWLKNKYEGWTNSWGNV